MARQATLVDSAVTPHVGSRDNFIYLPIAMSSDRRRTSRLRRVLRELPIIALSASLLMTVATGAENAAVVDLLASRGDPGCEAPHDAPRVALAMSGGGARGLAQIGVLQALHDRGIEIDLICGASMGAIIGGLHAAGFSAESLERIVRQVDWTELLQNTPSRPSLLLSQKDKGADWFLTIPLRGIKPVWPTGITTGQRLYNYLSDLTQRATYLSGSQFDSLEIRFRAVATDLVNGERVVLSDGELAFALRASMAFPLAVAPLRSGQMLLADAGLVDPLPVALADSLSDCPVVAINTSSGLTGSDGLDDPYALANQATTIMNAERVATALAAADFVCEPILDEAGNLGFEAFDTLLALGYAAGERLANEIIDKSGPVSRQAASHDEPILLLFVRSIDIVTTEDLARNVIDSVFALKTGMRYSRSEIDSAIQRVNSYLASSGLTLASVTLATIDSTGGMRVEIDAANVAGVRLTGNKSVKSWVILRSFPLRRGLPYNARKVSQGLADLHASGLFEQATAEVERTAEGPILHLRVTERNTDALRLGLRHDLEYQTDGFVQWAKTNLFATGSELTLHAQYAPRRQYYYARLRADRIFRTYLSGSARIYHHDHDRRLYRDHEQYSAFTTTRDGYELSFGQNISRIAHMALVITSEDIDLTVDSIEQDYRHSRFALEARVDDLDHAEFPTHGQKLTAQLSWGDDFFGGDVVYRAFHAEAAWYYSLSERITLSFGGQAGTADRVLPLHERFALGGRRSFMGLADDELLGDRLAAVSTTARYRFYPISYATVRIDVGNTWSKGAEINFWEELRHGVGAGLLFDTPLGPLSLLYSIANQDKTKFYFSWGFDF